MQLKHAVMLGVMGRYADRFHEYQPHRTFAERLAMAARVAGVDGIEVVFPQEFADVDEAIRLIRDAGLPVAAVNVNVKGERKWRQGAFTSPDEAVRADAVSQLRAGMDLAATLDCKIVTCCPLIDGHNYGFEVDYLRQWRWLEQGIADAAKHRLDINISLEYKLNESRNYNILADMGRTLYLCERLGAPNVGVTMDVGHALLAKEAPAEVMSIAAQAGKLFYIHLNDNAREWDWDMLPGSVNYWDLLEMLFYLDQLEWDGWVSYDVFTRNGDQIEAMNATLRIVDATMKLLDKIGRDTLRELIAGGSPARTFEHLTRCLL